MSFLQKIMGKNSRKNKSKARNNMVPAEKSGLKATAALASSSATPSQVQAVSTTPQVAAQSAPPPKKLEAEATAAALPAPQVAAQSAPLPKKLEPEATVVAPSAPQGAARSAPPPKKLEVEATASEPPATLAPPPTKRKGKKSRAQPVAVPTTTTAQVTNSTKAPSSQSSKEPNKVLVSSSAKDGLKNHETAPSNTPTTDISESLCNANVCLTDIPVLSSSLNKSEVTINRRDSAEPGQSMKTSSFEREKGAKSHSPKSKEVSVAAKGQPEGLSKPMQQADVSQQDKEEKAQDYQVADRSKSLLATESRELSEQSMNATQTAVGIGLDAKKVDIVPEPSMQFSTRLHDKLDIETPVVAMSLEAELSGPLPSDTLKPQADASNAQNDNLGEVGTICPSKGIEPYDVLNLSCLAVDIPQQKSGFSETNKAETPEETAADIRISSSLDVSKQSSPGCGTTSMKASDLWTPPKTVEQQINQDEASQTVIASVPKQKANTEIDHEIRSEQTENGDTTSEPTTTTKLSFEFDNLQANNTGKQVQGPQGMAAGDEQGYHENKADEVLVVEPGFDDKASNTVDELNNKIDQSDSNQTQLVPLDTDQTTTQANNAHAQEASFFKKGQHVTSNDDQELQVALAAVEPKIECQQMDSFQVLEDPRIPEKLQVSPWADDTNNENEQEATLNDITEIIPDNTCQLERSFNIPITTEASLSTEKSNALLNVSEHNNELDNLEVVDFTVELKQECPNLASDKVPADALMPQHKTNKEELAMTEVSSIIANVTQEPLTEEGLEKDTEKDTEGVAQEPLATDLEQAPWTPRPHSSEGTAPINEEQLSCDAPINKEQLSCDVDGQKRELNEHTARDAQEPWVINVPQQHDNEIPELGILNVSTLEGAAQEPQETDLEQAPWTPSLHSKHNQAPINEEQLSHAVDGPKLEVEKPSDTADNNVPKDDDKNLEEGQISRDVQYETQEINILEKQEPTVTNLQQEQCEQSTTPTDKDHEDTDCHEVQGDMMQIKLEQESSTRCTWASGSIEDGLDKLLDINVDFGANVQINELKEMEADSNQAESVNKIPLPERQMFNESDKLGVEAGENVTTEAVISASEEVNSLEAEEYKDKTTSPEAEEYKDEAQTFEWINATGKKNLEYPRIENGQVNSDPMTPAQVLSDVDMQKIEVATLPLQTPQVDKMQGHKVHHEHDPKLEELEESGGTQNSTSESGSFQPQTPDVIATDAESKASKEVSAVTAQEHASLYVVADGMPKPEVTELAQNKILENHEDESEQDNADSVTQEPAVIVVYAQTGNCQELGKENITQHEEDAGQDIKATFLSVREGLQNVEAQRLDETEVQHATWTSEVQIEQDTTAIANIKQELELADLTKIGVHEETNQSEQVYHNTEVTSEQNSDIQEPEGALPHLDEEGANFDIINVSAQENTQNNEVQEQDTATKPEKLTRDLEWTQNSTPFTHEPQPSLFEDRECEIGELDNAAAIKMVNESSPSTITAPPSLGEITFEPNPAPFEKEEQADVEKYADEVQELQAANEADKEKNQCNETIPPNLLIDDPASVDVVDSSCSCSLFVEESHNEEHAEALVHTEDALQSIEECKDQVQEPEGLPEVARQNSTVDEHEESASEEKQSIQDPECEHNTTTAVSKESSTIEKENEEETQADTQDDGDVRASKDEVECEGLAIKLKGRPAGVCEILSGDGMPIETDENTTEATVCAKAQEAIMILNEHQNEEETQADTQDDGGIKASKVEVECEGLAIELEGRPADDGVCEILSRDGMPIETDENTTEATVCAKAQEAVVSLNECQEEEETQADTRDDGNAKASKDELECEGLAIELEGRPADRVCEILSRDGMPIETDENSTEATVCAKAKEAVVSLNECQDEAEETKATNRSNENKQESHENKPGQAITEPIIQEQGEHIIEQESYTQKVEGVSLQQDEKLMMLDHAPSSTQEEVKKDEEQENIFDAECEGLAIELEGKPANGVCEIISQDDVSIDSSENTAETTACVKPQEAVVDVNECQDEAMETKAFIENKKESYENKPSQATTEPIIEEDGTNTIEQESYVQKLEDASQQQNEKSHEDQRIQEPDEEQHSIASFVNEANPLSTIDSQKIESGELIGPDEPAPEEDPLTCLTDKHEVHRLEGTDESVDAEMEKGKLEELQTTTDLLLTSQQELQGCEEVDANEEEEKVQELKIRVEQAESITNSSQVEGEATPNSDTLTSEAGGNRTPLEALTPPEEEHVSSHEDKWKDETCELNEKEEVNEQNQERPVVASDEVLTEPPAEEQVTTSLDETRDSISETEIAGAPICSTEEENEQNQVRHVIASVEVLTESPVEEQVTTSLDETRDGIPEAEITGAPCCSTEEETDEQNQGRHEVAPDEVLTESPVEEQVTRSLYETRDSVPEAEITGVPLCSTDEEEADEQNQERHEVLTESPVEEQVTSSLDEIRDGVQEAEITGAPPCSTYEEEAVVAAPDEVLKEPPVEEQVTASLEAEITGAPLCSNEEEANEQKQGRHVVASDEVLSESTVEDTEEEGNEQTHERHVIASDEVLTESPVEEQIITSLDETRDGIPETAITGAPICSTQEEANEKNQQRHVVASDEVLTETPVEEQVTASLDETRDGIPETEVTGAPFCSTKEEEANEQNRERHVASDEVLTEPPVEEQVTTSLDETRDGIPETEITGAPLCSTEEAAIEQNQERHVAASDEVLTEPLVEEQVTTSVENQERHEVASDQFLTESPIEEQVTTSLDETKITETTITGAPICSTEEEEATVQDQDRHEVASDEVLLTETPVEEQVTRDGIPEADITGAPLCSTEEEANEQNQEMCVVASYEVLTEPPVEEQVTTSLNETRDEIPEDEMTSATRCSTEEEANEQNQERHVVASDEVLTESPVEKQATASLDETRDGIPETEITAAALCSTEEEEEANEPNQERHVVVSDEVLTEPSIEDQVTTSLDETSDGIPGIEITGPPICSTKEEEATVQNQERHEVASDQVLTESPVEVQVTRDGTPEAEIAGDPLCSTEEEEANEQNQAMRAVASDEKLTEPRIEEQVTTSQDETGDSIPEAEIRSDPLCSTQEEGNEQHVVASDETITESPVEEQVTTSIDETRDGEKDVEPEKANPGFNCELKHTTSVVEEVPLIETDTQPGLEVKVASLDASEQLSDLESKDAEPEKRETELKREQNPTTFVHEELPSVEVGGKEDEQQLQVTNLSLSITRDMPELVVSDLSNITMQRDEEQGLHKTDERTGAIAKGGGPKLECEQNLAIVTETALSVEGDNQKDEFQMLDAETMAIEGKDQLASLCNPTNEQSHELIYEHFISSKPQEAEKTTKDDQKPWEEDQEVQRIDVLVVQDQDTQEIESKQHQKPSEDQHNLEIVDVPLTFNQESKDVESEPEQSPGLTCEHFSLSSPQEAAPSSKSDQKPEEEQELQRIHVPVVQDQVSQEIESTQHQNPGEDQHNLELVDVPLAFSQEGKDVQSEHEQSPGLACEHFTLSSPQEAAPSSTSDQKSKEAQQEVQLIDVPLALSPENRDIESEQVPEKSNESASEQFLTPTLQDEAPISIHGYTPRKNGQDVDLTDEPSALGQEKREEAHNQSHEFACEQLLTSTPQEVTQASMHDEKPKEKDQNIELIDVPAVSNQETEKMDLKETPERRCESDGEQEAFQPQHEPINAHHATEEEQAINREEVQLIDVPLALNQDAQEIGSMHVLEPSTCEQLNTSKPQEAGQQVLTHQEEQEVELLDVPAAFLNQDSQGKESEQLFAAKHIPVAEEEQVTDLIDVPSARNQESCEIIDTVALQPEEVSGSSTQRKEYSADVQEESQQLEAEGIRTDTDEKTGELPKLSLTDMAPTEIQTQQSSLVDEGQGHEDTDDAELSINVPCPADNEEESVDTKQQKEEADVQEESHQLEAEGIRTDTDEQTSELPKFHLAELQTQPSSIVDEEQGHDDTVGTELSTNVSCPADNKVDIEQHKEEAQEQHSPVESGVQQQVSTAEDEKINGVQEIAPANDHLGNTELSTDKDLQNEPDDTPILGELQSGQEPACPKIILLHSDEEQPYSDGQAKKKNAKELEVEAEHQELCAKEEVADRVTCQGLEQAPGVSEDMQACEKMIQSFDDAFIGRRDIHVTGSNVLHTEPAPIEDDTTQKIKVMPEISNQSVLEASDVSEESESRTIAEQKDTEQTLVEAIEVQPQQSSATESKEHSAISLDEIETRAGPTLHIIQQQEPTAIHKADDEFQIWKELATAFVCQNDETSKLEEHAMATLEAPIVGHEELRELSQKENQIQISRNKVAATNEQNDVLGELKVDDLAIEPKGFVTDSVNFIAPLSACADNQEKGVEEPAVHVIQAENTSDKSRLEEKMNHSPHHISMQAGVKIPEEMAMESSEQGCSKIGYVR